MLGSGLLRRRRRIVFAAAITISQIPIWTKATTRSWTGTNSNWSVNTNWSGSVRPGASDFAILSKTGNLVCTYDITSAPFTVGSILIEGNMTLAQGSVANTQLNPGSIIVGSNSAGTYSLSSGTFNASNQIILGQNAGGAGSVLLSGGSLSATTINVGLSGNGTFNQTAGTTTISNMSVGTSTGNGTLRLNGGLLDAGGTVIIGANGTFSSTGGGSTSTSTTINLAGGFASGTVNSNGSFISNSTSAAGTLTLFNTGAFIYNGGDNSNWTVSSSGSVIINSDWTATELLSNSTQPIDFASHHITLTGGTNSVAFSIDSTITLNGGTVDAHNSITDFEIVGASGTGNFIQTSGTNNGGILILGSGSTSTGNYTLTSGGLHLTSEFIGQGGHGALTQTGGINTTAALLLGSGAGASGTVLLSGGTITTTGQSGLVIGGSGDGLFQISGTGRIDTINAFAAFSPGSSGTIEMLGGAFNCANLTLGDDNNTSALMSQNGGAVTISGQLAMGSFDPGARASYVLLNGTLSCISEVVGVRGAATFNQSGGKNSTGFMTLGASTGASGAYTLAGGTLTVGNAINLNSTSQFIQTGGALTVGSFNVTSPITVPYTFTDGLLHLTNSPLNIGSNGLLGANVSTSPTRSIIIDQSTTLAPLSLLTVSGGTFSTGSFINNGGSVALTSGTLAVTNSGFTIGANQPLGSTVKLDFGANLSVSSLGVNVDPGAFLQLDGGAIYSTGTVTNNGQLLLSAPTALVSAGTFQNNGLLSGTGRITGTLNNGSLGEVRVDPADSLQFQAPGNNSAGKFTLNGGRIEFTQNLSISSTATVFGRGTLIADGGLTNLGSIVFSGAGNTDVFGNVTNLNRINITGGNTATFWSGANTLVGTISVNSNSTVVFAGTLAGQSHIIGPGIKDFEGSASGGPIATIVGDTIVEQPATVTADFLHEDDVEVFGSLKISPDGTPAHLSQINTLTIDSGSFDLTDNDLIVANTPIATIASDITSAFNHGAWTGSGLTSSHAAAIAADPINPRKTALGYATASQLGVTSFDGQPVTGSTVLVRYTYTGDANLDGVVNALDFNALATNFGAPNDQWFQGDFNYDGVVNTADFTELATNFGQLLPAPSIASSLVPEPATASLLLLLFARRRRFNSGGPHTSCRFPS